MHEFSMSKAIADSVLDTAEQQNAKEVLQVEIELGKLSFLNPEQVKFWVQLSFEGTIAKRAKLNIKVIEPWISCRVCGYAGKLTVEDDPIYHGLLVPSFSCPECESSQIEMERGRECTIKSIEILQG